MGEDAGLLRPEPHGHELLVIARWEVDEPVDSATKADRAPDPFLGPFLGRPPPRVSNTRGWIARTTPEKMSGMVTAHAPDGERWWHS